MARSLGFLEKPDPEQIDTDQINAGAYVVERSALELIPPGRAVSIEREVFPRLVGRGLFGRRLEGYWMDIGTPQRYLQASWDILEGAVQTDLPQTGGPFIDASARVAPEATIEPRAVVRAGCVVDAGCAGRRVGAARRLPDRRRSHDPRRDSRTRGRARRAGARSRPAR